MWKIEISFIFFLGFITSTWAINRDAYEYKKLEDLEPQQDVMPNEEIPEEQEADLQMQDDSYQTQRLQPYRPPSGFRPLSTDKDLKPVAQDDENFFSDVDALQEQYSEIRGRIVPRKPLKYPAHWKRLSKEDVLAQGMVPVMIKPGSIIYKIADKSQFTLVSKKFGYASSAFDSDGLLYLANKKNEIAFQVHHDQVSKLTAITDLKPDPKNFQTYDPPVNKDFYDSKLITFWGAHVGGVFEAAPYLHNVNSGPLPYGQGGTVEGTGFLAWRLPFYPGFRVSYSALSYKSVGDYEKSGQVITIGPELRWRWVGSEPGGDGSNLTFNVSKSIYSRINSSYTTDPATDPTGESTTETGKSYYGRIGWKIGVEIQNKNKWGHSLIGFKVGQDYINLQGHTQPEFLESKNKMAWTFGVTYGQEFDLIFD